MMESFLKGVARRLLEREKSLKELTMVFPNRRAGLFFTKQLSSLISGPVWMPRIITIEDLFFEHAGQRPTDNLTLLVELYEVYSKLVHCPESFDRFFFWGEIILKDFNDLDQFMVDAKRLYHHLADLKTIEQDWSYLTDHQVALIQAFWKTFERTDAKHQERFLKFWQILYPLYKGFRAALTTVGYSYSGMLYRSVAERVDELPHPGNRFAFVGFNAFTATEEILVKYYISQFNAEIYWDIDAYYLEDPVQEAGMFFRQYQRDRVLGPTFPNELPDLISTVPGTIRTYTTPLKTNQANLVGSIIDGVETTEAWEETVVILPDEQLLFPLLHYMPEKVDNVNVTMGYLIRNTPVYVFLETVLELQRYVKYEGGEPLFYYKPVKELLSSPYLNRLNPVFCRSIVERVSMQNQIYLSPQDLWSGGDLFQMVFHVYASQGLLDGLKQIILKLVAHVDEQRLERSYLYQCYKQLNRFKAVFESKTGLLPGLELVIRLFRQLFRQVRLPFEGEPLKGLQVMGVLESRNLDFRRVIVCDMNEGAFPPSSALNSMVPMNLRKAFGLPVQEQNDAVYAYTFYRLLHRAEEVHLIYTTAGEGGKLGEKSRYLHQLQHELRGAKKIVPDQLIFVPLDSGEPRQISIPKTPALFQKLGAYLLTEENPNPISISPSAVNTYLDCRLKFYFTYVAKLALEDEVAEDIDAAVFGNLVHHALEHLYNGFIKRKGRAVVEKEDFTALKSFIAPSVELAIRDHYFLDPDQPIRFEGQLLIARDILQKYIQGVLKWDESSAPFNIISLEAAKRYRAELDLGSEGSGKKVVFGGIIDRVDYHQGSIRLVDYKSGSDEKQFSSIQSLFDRSATNRKKAVMQTFLYGFLYLNSNPEVPYPLKPAIVNLREIFREDFNPYLTIKPERNRSGEEITDYRDYRIEFEAELREVVNELFDPELSFDQTEQRATCRICSFREICMR